MAEVSVTLQRIPELNAALLRKTLEHIEAHPETWKQDYWRCESGLCFAGTACDLDGGEWALPGQGTNPGWAELLVAREGEPGDETWCVTPNRVHARTRAQQILGITEAEAETLFAPENTLDDLREHVAFLLREDGEQA